MKAISERFKKLHTYLSSANVIHVEFAQKKLKQVHGLTMNLISFIGKAARGIKVKAGGCMDNIQNKLSYMENQMKVLYQESLWILKKNYKVALCVMNIFVIYSKAFMDTYKPDSTDNFEEAYLIQAKNLCNLAGFNGDEAEAKTFFGEANEIWETSKEKDVVSLFMSLKIAVAIHMGKKINVAGITFFDTYYKLIPENKKATINDYINQCRIAFGNSWNDEYSMRNMAAEYFIYCRWNITKLTNAYLEKYKQDHSRLKNIKSLFSHTLNKILESYLQLYESLLDTYYDESVVKFSQAMIKDVEPGDGKMDRLQLFNRRAMEVFEFYANEIKTYISQSHLYRWTSTVPVEFAKTNALRLKGLCGTVIKRFKEGMILIYNKGTNTVTVVVKTLSNTDKFKAQLMGRFKNLKGIISGCALILDFDADGWISMEDFCNSMKHLCIMLKDFNCIGGAKELYMKAIGSMKGVKSKTESTEVEKSS